MSTLYIDEKYHFAEHPGWSHLDRSGIRVTEEVFINPSADRRVIRSFGTLPLTDDGKPVMVLSISEVATDVPDRSASLIVSLDDALNIAAYLTDWASEASKENK